MDHLYAFNQAFSEPPYFFSVGRQLSTKLTIISFSVYTKTAIYRKWHMIENSLLLSANRKPESFRLRRRLTKPLNVGRIRHVVFRFAETFVTRN